MSFDITEHPHRRLNILTGEWIQVSPHRAKRPWQGQEEQPSEIEIPSYDPTCYLCPGNLRSTGERNPAYENTFSFVNDFSALVGHVPTGSVTEDGLLVAKSERGICKVICFSPDHRLTIAEMEVDAIVRVVEEWQHEFSALSKVPFIHHVQIFENKGAVMGCSNPHPHGQIWAQESIPVEPWKKHVHQHDFYFKNHRTLLEDYLALELKKNQRIVFQNHYFVCLVPFWATWPFETMIIPRRPMDTILRMSTPEVQAFAEAYKTIAVKYDNLFKTSFPYSAGIHQAPTDGKPHPEWHWHMSFYPPLLRSAKVKKFMVGYELLANPQRDIAAEFSAEKLRTLPDLHYKQQ